MVVSACLGDQQMPTKLVALPSVSDEIIFSAIHATGDRKLDVESLLNLVHHILCTVTDVERQEQQGNMQSRRCHSNFKSPLCILKKISCELMACNCEGEVTNVDKTSLAILNVVSSYSLAAKLVLILAALTLEFAEFWRIRKDLTESSTGKSPNEFCVAFAILKQVAAPQDPQSPNEQALAELSKLINLILKVTTTIFELEKLRSHYNNADAPELLTVIGKHVYLTITTIVTCATQITILKSDGGKRQDLSQCTNNLIYIYKDIHKHRRICQHQKEIEIYWKLISIFEYSSTEAVEILKLLIYAENDAQPLLIGGSSGSSTKEENIKVLRNKEVLLLISSLDISQDDISILRSIHVGLSYCRHFKIVWIPVVEQWTPERHQNFINLRDRMPWYIVQYVYPMAGIKFIKDEWHFNGKPMVVSMSSRGKVENLNAIHLIRLGGLHAYPFTKEAELAIKVEKNWLGLVAKKNFPTMESWIREEKYIFFFGGTDIDWIIKFKTKVMELASQFNSTGEEHSMKWLLIGNNDMKEGRDDQNAIGNVELFWTQVESLCSIRLREEVDAGTSSEETLRKLLSYKRESRWAVISKGSKVVATDHGTKIIRVLKRILSEKSEFKFEDKFETTFMEYYTKEKANSVQFPGVDHFETGEVNRKEIVKIVEYVVEEEKNANNVIIIPRNGREIIPSHSQVSSDDNEQYQSDLTLVQSTNSEGTIDE